MDPVETTLKAAESFSKNHRRSPEIQAAFGFTNRGLLTHPSTLLSRMRLQEMVTRVGALGSAKPLRILELDCGYGILANAIASLGHRVVAFDRRPDRIKLAKSFTQEQRLNAIFIGLDIANDPTWEKTAEDGLGGKPDVVVLASASGGAETEGLIGRLGSWLGKGAQLLIHQENPLSPMVRLQHKIRNKLRRSPDADRRRTYEQWRMILEAAGFHTQGSVSGLDPMPMLGKLLPERAWSLVFTAKKEI